MGNKWPYKIRNKKLYKKTKSKPISLTITERRWKLLGHILRLPAECPARKAMRYYFEERSCSLFVGRKRTTILNTLNRDIQITKSKYKEFSIPLLKSQVSLQNIGTKARKKKLWSKLVKQVVDAAYSQQSF